MRFELRVKNWRSYLPIVDTLANYRRETFNHDLIAGLILGIITVPQAIAYAFLAGLPAQAGLYACLVPMVIYAMLGSSKHLIVGPVAIAALMVASAVGQYAPLYSDSYLGITTILSLQAGLFLWILRLSQMGGIANLISHAVITGFVNAAAILIVISQLHAFMGLPAPATGAGPLIRLEDIYNNLTSLNPTALGIGLASVFCMFVVQYAAVPIARLVFPNLAEDHPISKAGPIVVVLLAGVSVWAANFDGNYAVATVGAIPSGMPALTVPPFDLALWADLAPVSALIAFVAYIESYSVGATLATREKTRINSHQELIALGASNIGAAFTGAYPVAGSFTRSSVNYQTGAKTQISALICMIVIVIVLLFITPAFAHLPHAALAAIIMVSVIGLIDLKHIPEQWRFYREDVITQMVTLLTVLIFSVEAGLITGVVLSIAFFIRESSRPHIVQVGRMPGTEQFKAINRYDVETLGNTAAVRIDENLYFANADRVENKLLKIIERRPGTRHLLLVCSSINTIDISGLEMLYRINSHLEGRGIKLHLSDVKGPPLAKLHQTKFTQSLSGSIYFTTDQAMLDLSERS
ncbi:MAG: SulP family inorganic anion transporter [Pseudomonadales bacterium]